MVDWFLFSRGGVEDTAFDGGESGRVDGRTGLRQQGETTGKGEEEAQLAGCAG